MRLILVVLQIPDIEHSVLARDRSIKMSADGCWVQFWDNDNFKGGTKRLDGAIDVPKMDSYIQSTGEKLGDEPDSLKTGTRSWLIVYKDENYKGKSASFGPNSSISDLDAWEDMGGKISSFRLYQDRPASFNSSTSGVAIEQSDGIVSSQTVNNLLRSALASAIGRIPIIGGTLDVLISALWPDVNNRDQAWAAFQNYIDQVVAGIFWQIRIDNLSSMLTALYDDAKDYVQAPPEQQKSTFLALYHTLNNDEPFFVKTTQPAGDDVTQPLENLYFFVPFATLHLATLRERIEHYEVFYDVPPDQNTLDGMNNELHATILRYRDLLASSREAILTKRREMFEIRNEDAFGIGEGSTTRVAIDTYSGWRGPQRTGGYAQRDAQYDADQQAEFVTNALAYKLDTFTAIGQLWACLDPVAPAPVKPPVLTFADGPYGSYQDSTAFNCNAGDGRITRLSIWTGSLVDSIEVAANGSSSGCGRYGHTGDGGQQTLDLATDEVIVSANGYETGLINALGFKTQTGRSIYGGADGGQDKLRFTSAAPVDTIDGRLTGISGYSRNGSSSNDNIKVLTFHWRCALPLDDRGDA
jgi:hypothetical protein